MVWGVNMTYMEYIYSIIFICVIFAELSPRVNTTGMFKQVALCLMAVGAIVSLSGNRSYLISTGVAIYLVHNIYYAVRKNRRRTDRAPNKQNVHEQITR